MKKRFLFVFDVAAMLVVVCFFMSGCYRLAFPLGGYDREISIVELFMLLPMLIGIMWLLTRALRKDRSGTYFYKFFSWLVDGGPNRRLAASAIGGLMFVGILKFMALIMREVL